MDGLIESFGTRPSQDYQLGVRTACKEEVLVVYLLVRTYIFCLQIILYIVGFFIVRLFSRSLKMSAAIAAAAGVPAAIAGAAVSAASHLGVFVPALIAAIAYFQYDLMDPESRPIDMSSDFLLDQYDFIIVGAGSAGAVLANRLSEVDQFRVLLLEAGGDETEVSDVPLMAAYLQLSQLDWKYKSEPQGTSCLGITLDMLLFWEQKIIKLC